uniref:Uncharacterized protein n=1 Tax=Arundo donax TaxID=35708 RepID=A0A0A9FJN8_ARUDO
MWLSVQVIQRIMCTTNTLISAFEH